MKIGVSGHQDRDGIDWRWVRDEINRALNELSHDVIGLSSLAGGADQVFARCVLESGWHLIAVIPEADYEEAFDSASDLEEYRALRAKSEIVQLTSARTAEDSFLNAGKWIVDHSDGIIAVWDGEPAEGLGGTADIVAYAQITGKAVLHLDPIDNVVKGSLARRRTGAK